MQCTTVQKFGFTVEGTVQVDFGKVRPTSKMYVLGSHEVYLQLPAHGSSNGISDHSHDKDDDCPILSYALQRSCTDLL
jgi:hypothetical protein